MKKKLICLFIKTLLLVESRLKVNKKGRNHLNRMILKAKKYKKFENFVKKNKLKKKKKSK